MNQITTEEFHTHSGSGHNLYMHLDNPVEPRAAILLVHGLHDHSGRYAHVSEFFARHGLRALRFDLSGYGKSEGVRGYLNHRHDHTMDVKCAADVLIERSDGLPVFAFGHSMGALFLSHYILEFGNPFKGVVYSGGLFKVNEDISPILQKMSGVVAAILPKLPTIKLDSEGLSRDPDVEARTQNDPLHYFGGVRARTGDEVLKATAELQARLDELDFPMLIAHGEKDPLTKYEASELLYAKSLSKDKTLKIYPGAKHELFNEINKEEVLGDAVDWIMARAR